MELLLWCCISWTLQICQWLGSCETHIEENFQLDFLRVFFFFFKILIIFSHVYLYVCECGYVHVSTDACGRQRFGSPEAGVKGHYKLGTELRSSTRPLNLWAISLNVHTQPHPPLGYKEEWEGWGLGTCLIRSFVPRWGGFHLVVFLLFRDGGQIIY